MLPLHAISQSCFKELSSDEQIKRLLCSQLALGGSLLMQSLSSFTTVSGTS